MSNDLTIETGSPSGLSLSMGNDGTELDNGSGGPVEFDTASLADEEDLKTEPDGDQEGADGEDDSSEGEDSGEPLEDLGEFDPEDTAAFDERYFPNGEIDKAVLSKEFFQNAEGGNPGLNEGTYEYLASKGISKGVAKEVEAALMTKNDAQKKDAENADFALFEVAGGADKLQTALEWGKKGGYDKAAQKAFNEAVASKDPAKRKEAVELLMYRHSKANPQTVTKEDEEPGLPKRDATNGSGGRPAQVKPFKNRQEWRDAKREAGTNQRQLRMVAERLNVSKF